jgi:hypothetical protein
MSKQQLTSLLIGAFALIGFSLSVVHWNKLVTEVSVVESELNVHALAAQNTSTDVLSETPWCSGIHTTLTVIEFSEEEESQEKTQNSRKRTSSTVHLFQAQATFLLFDAHRLWQSTKALKYPSRSDDIFLMLRDLRI